LEQSFLSFTAEIVPEKGYSGVAHRHSDLVPEAELVLSFRDPKTDVAVPICWDESERLCSRSRRRQIRRDEVPISRLSCPLELFNAIFRPVSIIFE
jgi:hypothetical protein